MGLALLAIAVPVALAAHPAQILQEQRVDVRVLLLTADGTQPGDSAWRAALQREGIPFEEVKLYNGQTHIGPQLNDAFFADYDNQHAKYNAVILESGDLAHCVDVTPDSCALARTTPAGQTPPATSSLSALSDAEWAALAKFERTFGIRQISDNTFPAPLHGLNPAAAGATLDGAQGTLTAAGKAAFPYLKGPIPIPNDSPTAAEVFGTPAVPVNPATWTTLVEAPNNAGAWLGIYTHPDDGREEMVMTVNGNEFQTHSQLLRHGMLNWVTRGVYPGYQRNYLELQVDDLFLPDDSWDPDANVTGGAVPPSRMTPTDVAQAVAWSRAKGIRIDFAYNGGGSELFKTDNNVTTDPLATAFQNADTRNTFGWINHTYDHPNIDCSTAPFITKEINDNVAWGRALGLPLDPAEVVTGEHSGLANTRPGNPGSIDAPSIDVAAGPGGAAVPAGTYEYGLTASTAAGGESTPATEAGVVVGAGEGVTATFNPVCNAATYKLYRRASTGDWSLVGTLTRDPAAATDDGSAPLNLTIADSGTGTTVAPPTANGAALQPYGQNPNYLAGVTNAGVKYVATDASKTYPKAPFTTIDPNPNNLFAAGTAFSEGSGAASFQTFPRWPTNVYYNTSTQGEQLDEYNWLYLPSPNGNCQNSDVTTCRATAAKWADYVTSENNIMFRHVMGNDPRPHFMHQSNLANWNPALPETDPNQGGILYAVVSPLIARYEQYIDRASTPLVQLNSTQIAQTLAQQATWAENVTNGRVSAWLQGGQLHVKNQTGAAMDVPLTGTSVGGLYGGQRSGWTSVPAGSEQVLNPVDPASAGPPSVTGSAKVGQTLTAREGAWTGTPTVGFEYRWQRCDTQGKCGTIPGAQDATYKITGDDVDHTLRAVVYGANWMSAVSQATSAPTDRVPKAATSARRGGAAGASVSLTRLKMHPRRFTVSHRKRRGTRLDGSVITWRLNTKARVHISVQRRGGSKGHRRWVTVTRLTRNAKAGRGVAHLTGRYGKRGRRLLPPRRYRMVVFAAKGKQHSRHKHMVFRVKKG